jgi:hypothetical protein
LLAVPARLELATFGLGNRCSIRLSYGTNTLILLYFSRNSEAQRAAPHGGRRLRALRLAYSSLGSYVEALSR